MAKYAVGDVAVLKQKTRDFLSEVDAFVSEAAKRGPHNRLSAAPPNFGRAEVETAQGTKIISQHAASGVVFKPGFQMIQGAGACKWEGQVVGSGLRLDLQGIANGYANWQVQTNKPAGQSKTIAGCLMKVDSCFSQRHLVHALKLSHEEGFLVTLTM